MDGNIKTGKKQSYSEERKKGEKNFETRNKKYDSKLLVE